MGNVVYRFFDLIDVIDIMDFREGLIVVMVFFLKYYVCLLIMKSSGWFEILVLVIESICIIVEICWVFFIGSF